MLRIPRSVTAAVLAFAAIACPTASAHEVPPGGVLTHGPDPEPPPAEIAASRTLTEGLIGAPAQKVPCVGNGTSGKRVQVMYVRASNAPDHYADSKAAIAAGAIDADRVFRESAAETSGMRSTVDYLGGDWGRRVRPALRRQGWPLGTWTSPRATCRHPCARGARP